MQCLHERRSLMPLGKPRVSIFWACNLATISLPLKEGDKVKTRS
jgi:hypothetical protein